MITYLFFYPLGSSRRGRSSATRQRGTRLAGLLVHVAKELFRHSARCHVLKFAEGSSNWGSCCCFVSVSYFLIIFIIIFNKFSQWLKELLSCYICWFEF